MPGAGEALAGVSELAGGQDVAPEIGGIQGFADDGFVHLAQGRDRERLRQERPGHGWLGDATAQVFQGVGHDE